MQQQSNITSETLLSVAHDLPRSPTMLQLSLRLGRAQRPKHLGPCLNLGQTCVCPSAGCSTGSSTGLSTGRSRTRGLRLREDDLLLEALLLDELRAGWPRDSGSGGSASGSGDPGDAGIADLAVDMRTVEGL